MTNMSEHINNARESVKRYFITGAALVGIGLANLGYGITRDNVFTERHPVPVSQDYNRVREINYALDSPVLTENRDVILPLLAEFSEREKQFRELIDSANALVRERDSLTSLESYHDFVSRKEDYDERRDLDKSIIFGLFGIGSMILGLRNLYSGRKWKRYANNIGLAQKLGDDE